MTHLDCYYSGATRLDLIPFMEQRRHASLNFTLTPNPTDGKDKEGEEGE